MKLHTLAHAMVWSVGLFTFIYLTQSLFIAELGLRPTATLLFILLIVSAILGIRSIQIFHQRQFMGMMTFGMISLFITTVLILTRLHTVGVVLFVLYCGTAIARLFKIIQTERAQARAARKAAAVPPTELPI